MMLYNSDILFLAIDEMERKGHGYTKKDGTLNGAKLSYDLDATYKRLVEEQEERRKKFSVELKTFLY